jgi:hypothetical protein
MLKALNVEIIAANSSGQKKADEGVSHSWSRSHINGRADYDSILSLEQVTPTVHYLLNGTPQRTILLSPSFWEGVIS